MQEFNFAILTGILSGLLTTIIYVFFYQIYEKITKPALINFLYKGVRLDGVWKGGRKSEVAEVKTLFNLKQSGFEIEGVLTAETIYIDSAQKDYSNQYKIKGQIKNNVAILNYEAISPQRTGVGVFVFQITQGGQEMSGQSIHSESTSEVAHMGKFKVERSF